MDGPSGTAVPGATTTTSSTTTTLASTEAIESFRQCLLESGVEIEEVPLDATGRPRLDLVMAGLDLGDPTVAAAVSTCSEFLIAGALDLGGEDALREAIVARLQAFSDCMVFLGVEDFPAPVPGFAGVGSPFPVAEIPYTDPEFDAAAVECRAQLLEDLGALESEP